MAASTLVIKDRTLADVDTSSGGTTLTLIGVTSNGAIYRDAARSLSLPLQVEYAFKVGTPGQTGNDTMIITVSQSERNSTTQRVFTQRAKLELSIPRDEALFGGTTTENLMAFVASIIGKSAQRVAIADAMVA